jgi:hypothetical protein
MGNTNLIIGLFLIGIGFLVKAFPDLIAGYNTMPKEQKENVDIKGLSSFMRNCFIAMGLTIIVGSYFFNWIGLSTISNSIVLISVLSGVTILLIKSRKFNKNESNKKSKAPFVILGIAIIFIISLLFYGSRPSKVLINNEAIHITGMYGVELPINDIREVKLITQLPAIITRSNGFSFGTIKKGYFKLEEYEKCRLFLQSDSKPYLIIIEKNGGKTILNHTDESETKTEFERLKLLTTGK